MASTIALRSIKFTDSTLNITQYLDGTNSLPCSLEPGSNDINMIEIKGVYKRYGKNLILNNLNMTVPEGCM